MTTTTLKTGNGVEFTVDESDVVTVLKYTWTASKGKDSKVRIIRHVKDSEGVNHCIALYRELLQAKRGEWVDHKDGNTLNNTRENLRKCSVAENSRNKRKSRTNSCGFKGVSRESNPHYKAKKWRADIEVLGRHYFLGHFHTLEEAAEEYDRAAREHQKEFACVNFPRLNLYTFELEPCCRW